MYVDSTLENIISDLLPQASPEAIRDVTIHTTRLADQTINPFGSRRQTVQQRRIRLLGQIAAVTGERDIDRFLWRVLDAYAYRGNTIDLSVLITLIDPTRLSDADRQNFYYFCARVGRLHMVRLSSNASFHEVLGMLLTHETRGEVSLRYLLFFLEGQPTEKQLYDWFIDERFLRLDHSRVDTILSDRYPDTDPLLVAFLYERFRYELGSVAVPREEIIAVAVRTAAALRQQTRQRQSLQQVGRFLSIDKLLSQVVRRFPRRYHRLWKLIQLDRLSPDERRSLFSAIPLDELQDMTIPSTEVFRDLLAVLPYPPTQNHLDAIRRLIGRFVKERTAPYRRGQMTAEHSFDESRLVLDNYYPFLLEFFSPEVREEDLPAWLYFLSDVDPRFFSNGLTEWFLSRLPTVPMDALPVLEALLLRDSATTALLKKISPTRLLELWRGTAVSGDRDRMDVFLRVVLDSLYRVETIDAGFMSVFQQIVGSAIQSQARKNMARSISKIGHFQKKENYPQDT
ncbi:hypothetical protein EBZ80_05335 [bacterium]|nr:hypothetical protein [bacterium]